MHHNEDHRISLLYLELSVNLFISHPNYEEIRQVALLTTEVNTSKHKKDYGLILYKFFIWARNPISVAKYIGRISTFVKY